MKKFLIAAGLVAAGMSAPAQAGVQFITLTPAVIQNTAANFTGVTTFTTSPGSTIYDMVFTLGSTPSGLWNVSILYDTNSGPSANGPGGTVTGGPGVGATSSATIAVYAGSDHNAAAAHDTPIGGAPEQLYETGYNPASGGHYTWEGAVDGGNYVSLLAGGTYTVEIAANTGADSSIGAGQLTVTTSVPELSTWAMMLAGFAGIGLVGVRRNRQNRIAI